MKKILSIIILINYGFITAQIVNIPDINFKNALINHDPIIDTNNDNEIQITEAEAFTGMIDVYNMNINELSGIEAFINIQQLNCIDNNINTLNLNNNTQLTELYCQRNNLNALDISSNTLLIRLDCSVNPISTLNVSNNTQLEYLLCFDNNLSSLDITNNTQLEYFGCHQNNLSQIDVSNNIELWYFTCSSNNLSSLDVGNNTLLRNFHFDNNNIEIINIDNNILLEVLVCSDNNLSTLNVSNNTQLESYYCDNNSLNTIELDNNLQLTQLLCANNLINTLDVSSNTQLDDLRCSGNQNLVSINLKNDNNNNFNLTYSDFSNLLNLQSICVDALNTPLTDFITSQVGHSLNYTVDCSTLSLDDNNDMLDFSVYPIPTENILNIKSKKEIVKIEIYSKLGQKIKESTENKIDISNLTQGLYFVKVEDVNGNFGTKKIVKK